MIIVDVHLFGCHIGKWCFGYLVVVIPHCVILPIHTVHLTHVCYVYWLLGCDVCLVYVYTVDMC